MRPRALAIILALALGAEAAFAQPPSVPTLELQGDQVYLRESETRTRLLGTIVEIPETQNIYHWTQREAAESFATRGITEAEFLAAPVNGNAVGQGMYFSLSPIDTNGYGIDKNGNAGSLALFNPKRLVRVIRLSPDFDPNIKGMGNEIKIREDAFWKPIREQMRNHALDGMTYPSPLGETWLNLIRNPSEFGKFQRVTIDDFYSESSFLARKLSLRDLSELNQKYPLKPDPRLSEKYPLVAKLIEGSALTEAELKELRPLAMDLLLTRPGAPSRFLTHTHFSGDTPFAKALRKTFHEDLKKSFEAQALQLNYGKPPLSYGSRTGFGEIKRLAAKLGFDLTSFDKEAVHSLSAFAESLPESVRTSAKTLFDRTAPLPNRTEAIDVLVQQVRTEPRAVLPLAALLGRVEEDNAMLGRVEYKLSANPWVWDHVSEIKLQSEDAIRNLARRLSKLAREDYPAAEVRPYQEILARSESLPEEAVVEIRNTRGRGGLIERLRGRIHPASPGCSPESLILNLSRELQQNR